MKNYLKEFAFALSAVAMIGIGSRVGGEVGGVLAGVSWFVGSLAELLRRGA